MGKICGEGPWRLDASAALERVDPGQKFRDHTIQLRRDWLVEIDLHQQRGQLRRLVQRNSRFARMAYDFIRDESTPFRDQLRGGLALLIAQSGRKSRF